MSLIRESCGCGGTWEGESLQRDERDKFREAHAACRAPQPSSNEEKLREALEEADGALMSARCGLDFGLGCARDLENDLGLRATKERSKRQRHYLKEARAAHRRVQAALQEETP